MIEMIVIASVIAAALATVSITGARRVTVVYILPALLALVDTGAAVMILLLVHTLAISLVAFDRIMTVEKMSSMKGSIRRSRRSV